MRELAEAFRRKTDRLDVLVNNVGALFLRRRLSADGIEMTLALNHLSYYLLTSLLLDLLRASAPARIVNVSSDAHRGATFDFTDPEFRHRSYSGWTAYSQSKLANVLFTYELAARLAGTRVTANALHPGFVATRFGHDNGRVMGAAMRAVQRVGAKSPEEGAQTSIYLASSPHVDGVTGKYFVDAKEVRSSDATYDAEAARRLWAVSAGRVQVAAGP